MEIFPGRTQDDTLIRAKTNSGGGQTGHVTREPGKGGAK